MRRSRRSTLGVVVLSVLLAGSAALTVVLGRQKVNLLERNRLLLERVTQAHPGLVVPEYPRRDAVWRTGHPRSSHIGGAAGPLLLHDHL